MKVLGTWIAFEKLAEKGMSVTSDDLMHGVIEGVGDQVKLSLKKGDKVVVSTVKKMQDMIGGKTFYLVNESQIIAIL